MYHAAVAITRPSFNFQGPYIIDFSWMKALAPVKLRQTEQLLAFNGQAIQLVSDGEVAARRVLSSRLGVWVSV